MSQRTDGSSGSKVFFPKSVESIDNVYAATRMRRLFSPLEDTLEVRKLNNIFVDWEIQSSELPIHDYETVRYSFQPFFADLRAKHGRASAKDYNFACNCVKTGIAPANDYAEYFRPNGLIMTASMIRAWLAWLSKTHRGYLLGVKTFAEMDGRGGKFSIRTGMQLFETLLAALCYYTHRKLDPLSHQTLGVWLELWMELDGWVTADRHIWSGIYG